MDNVRICNKAGGGACLLSNLLKRRDESQSFIEQF